MFHYACKWQPKRKLLAITVHPDLRIEVTAPTGTAPEKIKEKVLKRARWILKTRREFEKFHPLQPPRAYVPGEAHRYLGRQCRLKIAAGSEPAVKISRGQLVVCMPGKPTPARTKAFVEQWLYERATAVFSERLTACHQAAKRYKIPVPQLTVRQMSKRWGSCTATGRIILNRELIKAPSDCIDYVITHELCHIIEPNHNARFWQLLGAIMPDWQERRGRLNKMADV